MSDRPGAYDRSRSWERRPVRAAIQLGGAVFATFFVIAAPLLWLDARTSHAHRTPPLTAIAISDRVCPYLAGVQQAATAFQIQWIAAADPTNPWHVSQSKLDPALAGLSATLERAAPALPSPVRSRLLEVASNARLGLAVVRAATSFSAAVDRGYKILDAATHAYGEAATLVGQACGSLDVAVSNASPLSAFSRLLEWICGEQPSAAACVTTTTNPSPTSPSTTG